MLGIRDVVKFPVQVVFPEGTTTVIGSDIVAGAPVHKILSSAFAIVTGRSISGNVNETWEITNWDPVRKVITAKYLGE